MGKCYFNSDWLKDTSYSEWLEQLSENREKFKCKYCGQAYLIGSSGIKALNTHMSSQKHMRASASHRGSSSMLSFATKSTPPSSLNQTATSTTSNPTSTTTKQPTLKVADTLKAEVRWTMHLVSSHSSARSSDDIGSIFQQMFPDSDIAKQFTCGRTKVGYLATFGIAPAIRDAILDSLRDSVTYVIMFDESHNADLGKKQLDVHVRFIDSEGMVRSKYIDSYFLGHASANDIMIHLRSFIEKAGSQKILQLSMDGPNVNWKVFKTLCKEMEDDNGMSLINIGSCGLHTVHNSFKKGVEDSGWGVEDVLKSLYYLFKESPARREDFFKVTEASKLPLKFCGHRWLENVPAAERALQIWPAILRYLSAVKKGTVNKPGCKSFLTLVDKEGDYLFKAKLHTFIFVAKIAKPFLEKFQADAPLSPFLGADLFAMTKRLYSLILTPEYVMTVTKASHLKIPKDLPSNAFKREADFSLGHQAEVILKELKEAGKVSELKLKDFRQNFLKFIKGMVNKILSKSPLKYDIVSFIQCLDPTVITLEPIKAKKLFKKVTEHLSLTKWIQGDEVDQVLYDFETLVDRLSQSTVRYNGERLDEFFIEHGQLDSSPALKKVIQMVLLLSHGNADVERGFSTNKEATVENLLEESLVAKRLICQYVKDNGPLAEIPINKKMLDYSSKAHKTYIDAIDKKKKDKEESEQTGKRKRKAEEITDMKAKKRKIELDIDLLIKSADEIIEKAVKETGKDVHASIVKSLAFKSDATKKKEEVKALAALINEREAELKL